MSAVELDPAFEGLLEYLRDNRGFDFTGYKRGSLTRRIRKRMDQVGIEEVGQYHDYLEVHPEEFTHLFNTILINVTSFFRDESAWRYIAAEILPRILEKKSPQQAIRVWCVGCASGEEAYTAAMVLAEAVGLSELRERVKIYATDVDDEALAQARAGVYSPTATEAIPEELRERYLVPAGDGFAFANELRRTVIFGRHDLMQDAPISRVDLIVCRNTLMYFNAEAQTRIYKSFHFALQPRGFLFLGKSEMLLTRTSLFAPLDVKRRVFVRVPTAIEQDDADRAAIRGPQGAEQRLRTAVFESATLAQVVVDLGGVLVAANHRVQTLFGVGEHDLGRPFHELELSYRPTELRSRIERAISERRANVEEAVPWTTRDRELLYLDVEAVPLFFEGDVVGVSVTFADVTNAHALQAELERSRRELETAYEEIQSTVEELETTNEELQSTNEELETTNEELQSTNEELETMNEELQSTNEELETINTELGDRTRQASQANRFLEAVLESMNAGIVVVDGEGAIEAWNSRAAELWGLRTDEVLGQDLFSLDIGLPLGELRPLVDRCLDGSSEVEESTIAATDRRGRAFPCRVTCRPMRDAGSAQHGVLVLMEAAG